MRSGARRRMLLGVQGSPAWALCEGATVGLSGSPSVIHGGICIGAMGSRSGMNAGFSIPSGHKEGKSKFMLLSLDFNKTVKCHFFRSMFVEILIHPGHHITKGLNKSIWTKR